MYAEEKINEVLKPLGRSVIYQRSGNTFSGIDGGSQPSLAQATAPIGLGLPGIDDITFTVDLLGDNGSKCPGLVPLSTMI